MLYVTHNLSLLEEDKWKMDLNEARRLKPERWEFLSVGKASRRISWCLPTLLHFQAPPYLASWSSGCPMHFFCSWMSLGGQQLCCGTRCNRTKMCRWVWQIQESVTPFWLPVSCVANNPWTPLFFVCFCFCSPDGWEVCPELVEVLCMQLFSCMDGCFVCMLISGVFAWKEGRGHTHTHT